VSAGYYEARRARDAAIRAALDRPAAGQDRAVVDQAIRHLASTGRPFSAADVRELLPRVSGSIIGARFLAASRKKLIGPVGDAQARHAEGHARRLRLWQGAPRRAAQPQTPAAARPARAREPVADKAARLLTEGKVRIRLATRDGITVAAVQGDSGEYLVTRSRSGTWACSCTSGQFRSAVCSHRLAVSKIVTEPAAGKQPELGPRKSSAPTMLGVPDNGSVLVVPLRSNASTLVAGAPIAAMRRRLKFASLFYDRLFLESGILRIQAGPRGSSRFLVPPSKDDPPRWQTPAERRAATGATFVVAMRPEDAPDATPRTMVSSEATISWTATLHPFADELPPGTDWVEFVKSRDPAGEAGQLAQQWTWADRRNDSLKRAEPIQFVRETIISNANHDLALATVAGVAMTSDRLHSQVLAQRFNDEQRWQLQGYTVPVLFPHVGEMPWSAIADLRRDRQMAQFRTVLRDVEQEAMAEAAKGNVEKAAWNAYTRHLADASGKLESVATSVRRTAVEIVISGVIGTATLPIPAPWGLVVGTAAGAVPTTITNIRSRVRQSRSKGWVSVHQRLTAGRAEH
jgi:hypothetical protein